MTTTRCERRRAGSASARRNQCAWKEGKGAERGPVTWTGSSPELRPWREEKRAAAAFTSGEGTCGRCGETERAAVAERRPRAGATVLRGGELCGRQWRGSRAAPPLLLRGECEVRKRGRRSGRVR
jgi:hypothetical protein